MFRGFRVVPTLALVAGCTPAIRHHAPLLPSRPNADPIAVIVTPNIRALSSARVNLENGDVSGALSVGGVCVRRRSGKVGCIKVVREPNDDQPRLGGRWLPLPTNTVAAVTARAGAMCTLDAAGAVRCSRAADEVVRDDVIVLKAEGASRLVAVDDVVCAIADGKLTCQDIDNSDPSAESVGPSFLDTKIADAFAGSPCVKDEKGAMMCLESRLRRVSGRTTVPDVDHASLLLNPDVGFHGCISRAGKVMCQGRNSLGELGDGSREERFEPVVVRLPGRATTVSHSGFHGCALSDGDVWCWGRADDFALGRAGHAASATYPMCERNESPVRDGCANFPLRKDDVRVTPVPAKVAELGKAVGLATGMGITCALNNEGRLLCVGLGASGVFDITPPD